MRVLPSRSVMPAKGRTGPSEAPSVPSVRAVVRAASILKCFVGRPPLALADVAAAARLDKGTTRRLLLTLISVGFVVQNEGTQRYHLGRVLRDLGSAVADDLDLRSIAAPVLSDLATQLQVTAFLSIYDGHGAVCLERFHDMAGMEVRWWRIGGTLPLNCGGSPKLLLAYQSPEEIDRALSGNLVALTPRTITDHEILRRRLKLIARRGWELAVDDVVVGLTALSVALRGVSGAVVGAVSIAGLTPQMTDRGRPVHLDRLLEVAASIGARLP